MPAPSPSRRPSSRFSPAAGEKLQKALAGAGLGSRREIEGWIRAGRVSVNGEAARIGIRVRAGDDIRVDGRRIRLQFRRSRPRVLAYHKPAGEICTRADPEGRPTVFDKLPRLREGRWVSIGRLDVSTSGLLLFTNDGELAYRLMHPSTGIEREYAVRIRGRVGDGMLEKLRRGVTLEDGDARFEQIKARGSGGSHQWFHVVVAEGRNREVRRLWESQGVEVSRLIRVRYGPVSLPRRLHAGRFDRVDEPVLGELLRLAGRGPSAAAPSARRRKQARSRSRETPHR